MMTLAGDKGANSAFIADIISCLMTVAEAALPLIPCHARASEAKYYPCGLSSSEAIYRVGQNHRKHVLKISCIKFHLLTFQFVVIPHGKRDLSSLPEAGEAAVQIPVLLIFGSPA